MMVSPLEVIQVDTLNAEDGSLLSEVQLDLSN